MTDATMLGLAYALALLTYFSGVLIQTLPIPYRSIKTHAPILMWDSVVTLIAIGTVSTIDLVSSWISGLLYQSLELPDSTASFGLVITQLLTIDASIILIISALSGTVILAPVAELLSRMLGGAAAWVTNGIIFWTILQVVNGMLPTMWIVFWQLGIVFFSIPFRIGRKVGAYLMSMSVVSKIAFPALPSLAIWIEGQLGYSALSTQLSTTSSTIQSNPLAVLTLIASIPSVIASLIASVVIALLVFPASYVFMITLLARSLANMIAGSTTSYFVLTPKEFL